LSDIEDRALFSKHLVEALPDGTALPDECGVMRYMNELLTVLTGFRSEEPI
jgi:PAS domain-containing protein